MNPDPKKTSSTSLIRTVAGSELSDVVFDAAEVTLDSILEDGVLQDLPVIGSIAKLARAGATVAQELFVRKLLRFLRELQNIPASDRRCLLQRYPDGTPEQQKLGENLLLALERLDDIEKPAVLARFFAAYLRDELDYVTFTRLARALERFNLSLLPYLRWFYLRTGEPVNLTEELEHELSLSGLIG